MTYYDKTLNDDAAHEHVRNARRTGREWADSVWDALGDMGRYEQARTPDWPSGVDGYEVRLEDGIDDRQEREAELTEIAHAEASAVWSNLCEAFMESAEARECAVRDKIARVVRREDESLDGARERVQIWSSGDLPGADDWREVNEADLRGTLELYAESDAPSDVYARDRFNDCRRAFEEAIEVVNKGSRVWLAQDDDGPWFAEVSPV